jgi:predicted DNA-binding protein (MmcQ/YjbR family)
MDGDRRRVLETCAAQPFAERTFPFGNGVAVFKIGGKIFALVGLTGTPGEVSLKVDPELGAALVHQYGAVRPGYHLNKRHWVTVTLGGDLAEETLTELLEDAYDLVLSGLPRRVRLVFENVGDQTE